MDIEKTAQFIHTLNQQREYRTGHLPRSVSGIEALLSKMAEKDIIIKGDDEPTAVLGLVKDNLTARVIGPFTDDLNIDVIKEMWHTLIARHPEVESYEFYIDEHYQFGQQAMKALKTQYLGTQYTMTAEKLDDDIDTRQVLKYRPIYKKSFCELLKNLYVDAADRKDEILSSLGNGYELFILLSEGIVKGYVTLEVNNNAVCYIDHVETHKHYRQQGIGHKLVANAAQHALREHHATAIQLTVEDKRKKSIEFYEKLGFVKTDAIHHFKYSVH